MKEIRVDIRRPKVAQGHLQGGRDLVFDSILDVVGNRFVEVLSPDGREPVLYATCKHAIRRGL